MSLNQAINLQEEFYNTKVMDILVSLDEELVGLQSVKNRIREISALLLIDRARKNFGLSSTLPSLHMSFTGSPGTGKTSVGEKMADILYRLDYVRKGHLVTVTRDDLVGQYIGHTAPKTKNVLKEAMGGILFIDEAYYLYKADNERDYGGEAIEILLQVMENQRDDLVVVFAGYKDKMDEFYRSNPGLASRVANHIDFPDYNIEELSEIARRVLESDQYEFDMDAEREFINYIGVRMNQPLFANGRSIRNALDRAKMRQASRLFALNKGSLTKKDLVQIKAEDLRGSSMDSTLIQ
uniref:Putative rubisco expression protein CfxQ n=1 Tax=Pinguiococcus pyrenoidosus TaxID=172671 RepID=A0A0K1IJE5_9STRA|nr:putative rubisco expression protein CfxQ [Pinguiococcus pyrenoidosus]